LSDIGAVYPTEQCICRLQLYDLNYGAIQIILLTYLLTYLELLALKEKHMQKLHDS